MISYFFQLFAWMPPVMQVVVYGVIAIFLVWSVLKIIQIILDCIPFL